MFVLNCERCSQESHEWWEADSQAYPDSSERERFDRRLIFLDTRPVDNCPDCRVL